eukprot:IDg17511t1
MSFVKLTKESFTLKHVQKFAVQHCRVMKTQLK